MKPMVSEIFEWKTKNVKENICFITAKENPYSFCHLLRTVNTQWLDSDDVGDDVVTTMLPAINNDDYTTVQSLCSQCA